MRDSQACSTRSRNANADSDGVHLFARDAEALEVASDDAGFAEKFEKALIFLGIGRNHGSKTGIVQRALFQALLEIAPCHYRPERSGRPV